MNQETNTEVELREKYKSNSHQAKEPFAPYAVDPEKKVIMKVVTGKVISREKTLGKKFAETFCGEDVGNIGMYILRDVLVPAVKNVLWDIVTGGLEMSLFGELKGSRSRNTLGSNGSRTNYGGISSNRNDTRRAPLNINRQNKSLNDIVIATRGEAEEVLSTLSDLVIDYGQATIADLYGMVGIDTSFTDNNFGWTDLRSARVSRARDGYLLDLPKAVALT